MQASNSVRPLASHCLRVRDDLVFTPQLTNGRIEYYIVEDPLTARFFRLGVAESELARRLDGQSTIQQALAALSIERTTHRLSLADAIALSHWLVEMDLAQSEGGPKAKHLVRRADAIDRQQRNSRWNPLGMRLTLLQLDPLIQRLIPHCGWMFSRWCFCVWVIMLGVGIGCIGGHWQRFLSSSKQLIAIENGWWLLASWVGLKILHEMAHSLACKRYGGTVREAGVQCLWFVPMPYVDVTSCWRFPSRWPRIVVASAGMYAEFAIASTAAVVWACTDAGTINYFAYNLVIMASLTTFLFNANPLMKLDGYYVVSDLVGIPNLYQHGQRHVQSFWDRVLLGLPTAESLAISARTWFVSVYGWLSFAWRIVFSATITLAMARYAGQAGIWVACILCAIWLFPGLHHFTKAFVFGRPGVRPQRARMIAITIVMGICLTGALNFLPWPGSTQASAIVEYSVPVTVRAAGSGRVAIVHVTSGQLVQSGDLLITQENRELAARVESLRCEIQQSVIRERRLQQKSQVASLQAESEQRIALEVELAAKERELDDLEIRAPHAGKIDHPDLASLEGRFFKEGDEILRVSTDANKELRVAIYQQDYERFAHRVGHKVRIAIPGFMSVEGTLEKIIPRATMEPIDPALAAINGGDLPVRPRHENDESSSRRDEGFELLTPCLEGIVSIDDKVSSRLLAGQRAAVRSLGSPETIGSHLCQMIDEALRSDRTGE